MIAVKNSAHKESDVAKKRAADVQLAQAAAQGDRTARRQLVSRLSDKVRNTVYYLAAGHPDADDYAQMAFIEILQSIGSFRGESSLEAWTERITVRTAMRQIKKVKWRSKYLIIDSEKQGVVTGTAEESLRKHRVSRRMAELLGGLKPKHRLVVTLKLVMGHSIEEISAMTDINVNTVKYRLRMGRRHLRSQILDDPLLAELVGDLKL
jgi:RNA polymerase sigma-70 factor, ECF subfamily